ncbi:hypothetical protein ACIQGZ_18485 [Streptomyces sp. NPDC092296]|uniref:hypothetical protein n=1 Tax=Streptomyces sp. NPDC092296 TaxID=3366012 RepID=UPI0037FB5115
MRRHGRHGYGPPDGGGGIRPGRRAAAAGLPAVPLRALLGVLLGVLLGAAVLTACGSASGGAAASDGAGAGLSGMPLGSRPGAPGAPPTGRHRVDIRLDFLQVGTGVHGRANAVLTSPEQARRYPAWFDASGDHQLAGRLRDRLDRPGAGYPPPGQALVAVTAVVGCGQPRGAELWAGGGDLAVRWTDTGTVPRECLAPFTAVAVFRVPVAELPPHPTVDGRPPGPAGP